MLCDIENYILHVKTKKWNNGRHRCKCHVCGGEAAIYGGMREGLVFRSVDGVNSFKAVDNNFLVKYHG